MNTILRTCLAISLASFSFAALAAEPKPDFKLKTKSVEASVSLDGKIKANAALAADCLARAVARAVYEATTTPQFPSYRERYGAQLRHGGGRT